jgi:LemA protein
MANELDELNPVIKSEGLDTNVIAKQLPVTVGTGSKIFEIALWVCGIIPGIVFAVMKVQAKNYFQKLQQKIQHNASQIDNYLEQRVVVLQNTAKLLDKAVDLDKTTFENIAKYRSGNISEESRNELAGKLDAIQNSVNIAFENYPDLKAHQQIADAMQQNMYLQREITAARELYNDTISTWNREIFSWPTKMIVASKRGYTTRIPFATTKEIKDKARDVFF